MSTYEISKSSLLSLKAEILKKQEEVKKAKLENKVRIPKEARKGPLELKNKGVEGRLANDYSEEELNLLKKSRSVLEAKAKLYDKLCKGPKTEEERETNQRYLVHFDEKSRASKVPDPISFEDDEEDKRPESEEDDRNNEDDYNADNSDDEWVEYVDCLGRTRTCLKKDLSFIKEKDSSLRSSVEPKPHKEPEREEEKSRVDKEEKEEREEFDEDSEMLSSDMRRELQRQKWEKEEAEINKKTNVHYQDILFSEARTHGVGYYGFSKDEEERAKQQADLKKLRDETAQQQKLAQDVRKNREKQLKARVLAAKNRKRARMGLPPLTSDDEEEVKPKEVVEEVVKENPKSEGEILKEQQKEVKRKLHVRPWDVGKEGVKEHVEYTQEEWVQIQRKKREKDFAPPRSYNSTVAPTVSNHEDRKTMFSTTKRDKPFDVSQPPPVINNPAKRLNPYLSKNYKPINSELSGESSEEEDRLMGDFRKIDKKVEEYDKNPTGSTTKLPSSQTPPTYNPSKNMKHYASREYKPIENELSGESSEEDRLMGDFRQVDKKGVEIAPPATYDYYGPNDKRRKVEKSKGKMEDSIMQGLKFFRDKVEKKKM